MKIRALWKMLPHPDVAEMSATFRLWDSIRAGVYNIEITAEQKQLLDALESVNGFVAVSTSLYDIRVEKGSAFTWDEIRPRVESVFSEWANAELEVVVVDRPDAMPTNFIKDSLKEVVS